MYKVRRWAVRHARLMETIYRAFEPFLTLLHPLWRSIGYHRVERPVRRVEQAVKGFLFDCRMCGQCSLGDTGMSCPMNCPKNIRNGPCGGVRADGTCEQEPGMACVWVEAWRGSQQMKGRQRIHLVQVPIDNRLRTSSSWLSVVRKKNETGVDHPREEGG